ncbi:MAG: DUF2167 domain-containing protein [Nitrospiraceae bacterium]
MSSIANRPTAVVCLILSLAVGAPLFAQEAEPTPPAQPSYAWQPGPLDAKLGDQATLRLPAEYMFLDGKEAARLLSDMGNFPSGDELGLVAGAGEKDDWFVVIRFEDAGYVKDDDATNWNADEMLAAIKEGTDVANEKRRERGIDVLTIRGWQEPPHYDKASNKVVWAIAAEDRNGAVVNYNTLALGRHGYMSMNLVGGLDQLAALKPHAATLLANLNFVDGKRYVDFNSATDKVAAVGLAALIAGAAFKSGLLAKLLLLLVAFKKVILVAGAGLIGWIYKLVKGRETPTHSA